MTLVAGASRFLTQSTLASVQGSTLSPSNILEQSVSSSLLDVGRSLQVKGLGISSRARQLNNDFLNKSSQNYNTLFSFAGASGANVDAAKVQINALRASLPESQIAPSLRGTTVDEQA